MTFDFCMWAPWVFSALAGLVGWLLRLWYDDKKINALRNSLDIKEKDIYHLHEAHELLLKDKEEKLSDFVAQSDLQSKSILELQCQLEQAETSNKSLLVKVVDRKKELSSPKKTKVTVKSTVPLPFTSSKVTKSKSKSKVKVKAKKKGKKKRRKYKTRYKRQRKIITDLQNENERLQKRVGSSTKVKEIIKEIPITILERIRIRQTVDHKKLKKLIDNIPLKTKKKTLSKKTIKGKARVVKQS